MSPLATLATPHLHAACAQAHASPAPARAWENLCADVRRRESQARVADVTLLGSKLALDAPPAFAPLRAFLRRTASARPLDFVKARFAAGPGADLSARRALFGAFRAAVLASVPRAAFLWIGDDPAELAELRNERIDAFVTGADLRRLVAPADARRALVGLRAALGAGRRVHLLLGSPDDDVAPAARALAALARLGRRHGPSRLTFGATVDARGPWLPDVCLGLDPARAARQERLASALRAVGLPLAPALAPYDRHARCPVLGRPAGVFEAGGRARACLRDDLGSARLLDPLARCPARCRACALVALCLNECPRLAWRGACRARPGPRRGQEHARA